MFSKIVNEKILGGLEKIRIDEKIPNKDKLDTEILEKELEKEVEKELEESL